MACNYINRGVYTLMLGFFISIRVCIASAKLNVVIVSVFPEVHEWLVVGCLLQFKNRHNSCILFL